MYSLWSAQLILPIQGQRWWRSGLERWPRKRKVGCSNLSRDRPKSLKQLVTAPLPNARQKVRMSPVLGDDHKKTDAPCHIRCGTLKNPHCSTAITAEHRSKFAALHQWVKNSRVGRKTQKKKHKKFSLVFCTTLKKVHTMQSKFIKTIPKYVQTGACAPGALVLDLPLSRQPNIYEYDWEVIIGSEGLQILTYARHSWPLCS